MIDESLTLSAKEKSNLNQCIKLFKANNGTGYENCIRHSHLTIVIDIHEDDWLNTWEFRQVLF